jgi:hypothetical protein
MQTLERRLEILEQRAPSEGEPRAILVCSLQVAGATRRPARACCNGQTVLHLQDETSEEFEARAVHEIKLAQPGRPSSLIFLFDVDATAHDSTRCN